LACYEIAAGIVPTHEIDAVLDALGLGDMDRRTPVDVLSGGQKTRLGLARLLLSSPQLPLLDEPTNHLDIAALEWLEGFLRSCPGGALIVSRDRTFLERTVISILEIDPLTRHLRQYWGSYSSYASAKRREQQKLWSS
jgi:ATPase subunit of ABC transporter with duplicated ATPase domains